MAAKHWAVYGAILAFLVLFAVSIWFGVFGPPYQAAREGAPCGIGYRWTYVRSAANPNPALSCEPEQVKPAG
jgi:hypothetical protein